jgi:prepilin-type N-terminal cleavage/methylation domain-containing protein
MPLRRTGFTLVEFVLVMAVIGLLLEGVLNGRELILNTKIKATFNLTREVAGAIDAYRGRYGQLPGDDPLASTHFPGARPAPVNGPGRGALPYSGGCLGGSSTAPPCEALYELRLAETISGTGRGPIHTPLGGWAEIASAESFYPLAGNGLAMGFHKEGISYSAAKAFDEAFDDGNPATGNFRCLGLTNYETSAPDTAVPDWCSFRL